MTADVGTADVAAIELLDELGTNATIVGNIRLVGTWIIRSTRGVPFNRANSALVLHGDDVDDLDEKLAIASVELARVDMPLQVHLSPAAHPLTDEALAARGLVAISPTLALTTATADLAEGAIAAPDPGGAAGGVLRLEVADEPVGPWLDGYAGDDGHGMGVERFRAYVAGVGRLVPDVGYCVARIDGRPAGVGFAVAERGWVGYYGIGTEHAARGRGVGTAVMGALAAWARDRGAASSYLFTEADNVVAHRLYARLGFAPHHRSHFRVRAQRAE